MYPVQTDPLTEFFDAIKSPGTKDRYGKRLDLFLRHIGVEGSTFDGRAKSFAGRAKADAKRVSSRARFERNSGAISAQF